MAFEVRSSRSEKRWALKVACLSRVAVMSLQFLAPLVLPKHENDGFEAPAFKNEPNVTEGTLLVNSLVKYIFKGLLNWDGQYFLHVATDGYTSENMFAFFPLFPKSVQVISTVLYCSTFGLISSFTSMTIVVGLFLNFLFFIDAAATLFEILESSWVTRRRYLTEMAMILFSFNPASVFFSAFYSEAMFVNWTLRMFRALQQKNVYRGVSYAAMSALTRSNGILNAGFVLAYVMNSRLKDKRPFSLSGLVNLGVQCFAVLLGCSSLFLIFQIYCWCHMDIPAWTLPYQYIQRKYWNVGLFRYWRIKQLPNFLLALPVLMFQVRYARASLRTLAKRTERLGDLDLNALAPIVHALFLAVFCLTSMHVQVSTRLILSSCPYLYFYYAIVMARDIRRYRSGRRLRLTRYNLKLLWYTSYFVLGTMLFAQGYPWT